MQKQLDVAHKWYALVPVAPKTYELQKLSDNPDWKDPRSPEEIEWSKRLDNLDEDHNMKFNEFAPGNGRDDEPYFNPETFYDIPKLKKVQKLLANRSVNSAWYDLQLKVLIRYMEDLYIINADVLDDMFPTAPEIANYIERNIIKAFPSETPPHIVKNPNYKPRPPRASQI